MGRKNLFNPSHTSLVIPTRKLHGKFYSCFFIRLKRVGKNCSKKAIRGGIDRHVPDRGRYLRHKWEHHFHGQLQ